MIRAEDLAFAYGDADRWAIRDVDVTIRPGTFVVVAGASASGKSTLLRALGGRIPHFHGGRMQGRVRVGDRDTRDVPVRELARRVGVVLQDPAHQTLTSTVRGEIAFPLENLGVDPELGRRRIHEALAAVGLTGSGDRDPADLSDGERQRVALAAALAPQPDVLLLDEPTAMLDPSAARTLLRLLSRLRDDLGLTIVLAGHRLAETAPLADRIVVLSEGRVVADGAPGDVLARPVAAKAGLRRPPVLELAIRLGLDETPLTVAAARDLLDGPLSARDGHPEPRPAGPALARFEDVVHRFDARRVLDGVDLTVHRGETLGVVGPSGAGKTTLVEHLDARRHPDAGRVVVDGEDTRDADLGDLADTVGRVPADPSRALFAETVRGELEMSLRDRDLYGRETWIDRVLAWLGLDDVPDRHPHDLSGGQRQRLAVGVVAVRNPALLVLDEPTRGLDPGHLDGLVRLVSDRRRRGRTTVLVTHEAELVARTCDRVAHLAGGRIVGPSPTREALASSRAHTTQVSLLDRSLGGDGRCLLVDEVVPP